MNVLLDTCTLIWWLTSPGRIPERVRRLVEEADEAFVSAASLWEIATKHRLGRLPEADTFAATIEAVLAEEEFSELPVGWTEAAFSGRMAGKHADPFDRFLAAQAILYNIPILTPDAAMDEFGVSRIW